MAEWKTVLLFLSDAVPYMKKAGKSLKVFYSKMIHVTCAARGLHRIAKQVRDHFSTVDKIIANCKKVVKKLPTWVKVFKIEAQGVCLPPDPLIQDGDRGLTLPFMTVKI